MSSEELLDRVDDAIEDALLHHDMRVDDNQCSCGARNNMDGDVLHGHRLGAVTTAVHDILVEAGVVTDE